MSWGASRNVTSDEITARPDLTSMNRIIGHAESRKVGKWTLVGFEAGKWTLFSRSFLIYLLLPLYIYIIDYSSTPK